MKTGCIFTLLLLTLTSVSLHAQSGEDSAPAGATGRYAIGVTAGGTYMLHGGGFSFPREAPPRIAYDEASGYGPAFGVRVDIPLGQGFQLSPRLFAECRRGDFTSDPFVMEIIGRDLRPQDMLLEDELDMTLRVGGLDLLVTWYPAGSGFYLAAGPSIGMRLYEEFRITESIRSPAGVSFLDGSTSREMYDDDPGITRSLHLGLRAGPGYRLAIGSDLALALEVLYLYPLQSVAEDSDWTVQGLQGGVSLLFIL